MTDTERLDFLEARLREERYTGRAICRWSMTGRGIRLHETSFDIFEGASKTIREAIDEFAQSKEGGGL